MCGREVALAASEGANRKARRGKRERRLTEEGTERERETMGARGTSHTQSIICRSPGPGLTTHEEDRCRCGDPAVFRSLQFCTNIQKNNWIQTTVQSLNVCVLLGSTRGPVSVPHVAVHVSLCSFSWTFIYCQTCLKHANVFVSYGKPVVKFRFTWMSL